MPGSSCCFLTCIQVSHKTGKVVWYSQLLKNFPVFFLCVCVIHIVKVSRVVNEAEIDVFLEFPCFFYGPSTVRNLIPCPSAFSKPSLYIWKFFVHMLLKPSLKDLGHSLTNVWNECNCMVIWTFFGIALLWDWNENWLFPVPWLLLSFSNLLGILSAALQQQHLLGV